MKKLRIKKVNVLKVAFVFATMYGILSAIVFAIIGIFGIAVAGDPMGAVLMILMPIFYAIGGFIGGLLMGWLYNLTSKWIGGIEVEVEEIEKFSE